MKVAAEHRTAQALLRKARDRLANEHQYLCWWRAFRTAQGAFSPWPDPNAPTFVPLAAPSRGPITRMRAAAAGTNTTSPKLQSHTAENAKNNSEERWHSRMADYERTQDPGICEGCGSTARLWICECGARLCSGHCMGLCSACGGELSWGSSDSHSDSDTLSEDY